MITPTIKKIRITITTMRTITKNNDHKKKQRKITPVYIHTYAPINTQMKQENNTIKSLNPLFMPQ